MCADRLAEDYDYKWEEREDSEPVLYECDHCHRFVREEDYHEYKDMFICGTCLDDVDYWEDDIEENA